MVGHSVGFVVVGIRVGHFVGFCVIGVWVGHFVGFNVGGGGGGIVGDEVTSSSSGGKDGNTISVSARSSYSCTRLTANEFTSCDAQGFMSIAVADISSVTKVHTDGHCGRRRFILQLPIHNADVTN
jgi:uncharacterized protein YcfJ